MNTALLNVHSVLTDIFNDGAFSTIQLNKKLLFAKNSDKALITKVVYGVLEKNIELEYVLSQFVKKINKQVAICLKIGVYCLMYLNIPTYAVVNDVVELSKVTGDIRLVGFVNATLKNVAKAIEENKITYPDNQLEYLSVKYSYPLWAVKKLVKDYGREKAEQIVSANASELTTIRVNTDKITVDDFEKLLTTHSIEYTKTMLPFAFFVKGVMKEIDDTLYTVQSLGSMLIALSLNTQGQCTVLDCCSAPGGKAVFIKQYNKDVQVTACDLHQHRVQLIDSYASRMGVNIDTVVADMSMPCDKLQDNSFDYVLCDVPCSGFGVIDSRPDIKLFRQEQDISNLMKLQYAIVDNCLRYLKSGGVLIYSTCTVFKNENDQIVNKLLKNHPELKLDTINIPYDCAINGNSMYQFLPDGQGMQGFFVARLVKN